MPTHKLVFLDESGCNLAMALLYARAPVGERAVASKPVNRGKNYTLLGAMSASGLVSLQTVEGAANTRKVLHYLKTGLLPRLEPGQVVVMDNLRAHHAPEVRHVIEKAGARVLYLPPYSPEFSPIELCWSKFKRVLRRAAARSLQALRRAIRQARAAIHAENASAWFRHCGYP